MDEFKELSFQECWNIIEEMTPNMTDEEREEFVDDWGE